MRKRFPFFHQYDQMDCGPICLRMIAKYYGRTLPLELLRNQSRLSKAGATLLGLSEAAERIGFKATGLRVNMFDLKSAKLPCVLHWNNNHFVVLYGITKKGYKIADPACGKILLSQEEFASGWLSTNSSGIILNLETTSAIFETNTDQLTDQADIGFFRKYLFQHKTLLLQLLLAIILGTAFQMLIPFLTGTIIDFGVANKNVGFIRTVLAAQFMLLLGRTTATYVRSWILLQVSIRFNVHIMTTFLSKLMRLPLSFFQSKHTGDIIQRINDQKRIETFFTSHSLAIVFALFNLIVFSIVLGIYNLVIFSVFFVGTVAYAVWIYIFLGKRKSIDHSKFDVSSKSQSMTLQMVDGIQEIKLSCSEKQKRWDWEYLQSKLYKLNFLAFSVNQYQQVGSLFINEGKNIILTYLLALEVINGGSSIGTMMAIQYIIGQLNSPVEQALGFINAYQDTKISIGRLNEINGVNDEIDESRIYQTHIGEFDDLIIRNLSFSYNEDLNSPVLSNINLSIPRGKTTAIVGKSGSGKTTIIKLLLGFYQAQQGDVAVGFTKLRNMDPHFWRSQCGVVMQDSFLFSDTVFGNITIGDPSPDRNRVWEALKLACLDDFVASLPLGIDTVIGSEGVGVSQGQRQRIMIARAVYKDPQFIFLDEATNALDGRNELMIVENLNSYLTGRTVVVVAHRLSTVKNADNIVVVEKGSIAEQGSHKELLALQGIYCELISNQLELSIN